MDVVLRTAVAPRSLAPAVASVVRGLDAELPVARLSTLDEIVARSISEPRFYVVLLGAFAGTALFLAALGIFGVMSYAVVQRSREIGIRVALGAEPVRVMTAVIRDGLAVTVGGIAVGFLAALGTSVLVKSLLFGITNHDPLTLFAAPTSLIVITVLACLRPAARAARVDPTLALRAE
jgi:ABC-type antimicrobial peptide transport system permease subunit